MIRRSYRFRLYPSRNQEVDLIQNLENCRWLFNHMLEKKNDGCTYKEIQAKIPKLVKDYPFLSAVHSKTRQYVLWQLRANLKALAGLKKKGFKVGRIRFRAKNRYKTFVYNQSGFKIADKKLHLSKLGDIPLQMHREINGEINYLALKGEV